MVAVNRRFYSIIQRARELLAEAGGLRAIRVEHTEWMHESASWGLSPDILNRYFYINGIHLLDTMCHLAGLPCSTDSIVRKFPGRRNAYDAMFQFGSGAVGHYSGQWYAPGRWALDLFADDLRITFPRMEEAIIQRTGKDAEPLLLDEIDKQFKPGFYRQMEAFVEKVKAAKSNKYPPSSIQLQRIEQISNGQAFNPKSNIKNATSPISCFLPEAVEIMRIVERFVDARHLPSFS